MSTPEIKTLSSTVVYQNRWMTVREDRIVRADGSPGIYGVVEKTDFAIIAAIEAGHVHLVEQYRYPIGMRRWELPQGTSESGETDPLMLARAELREETGIIAGRIEHVARLHEAYGYSTQALNLFVATELEIGTPQLELEEQGLISRAFPIAEACEMICNGIITDAATVACFGLLRMKGLL